MRLGLRLALLFSAVAIATAAAVAIATPIIVGHGFTRVLVVGDDGPPGAGGGNGAGQGRGRNAGQRAHQVEEETIVAIVLVAAAAAAIASVAGIVVARRIARPLEGLERVAADVAAGDLTGRSGLAGRHDELGSLGRSFDAMAASLQASDEARRRLIQDVSHELRTPLTVIDATVDAMLDGVWLREDRHLETVRAQSRLLAHIVDDLRTAALAESGRLMMQLAAVPLDAVVADVAAGFLARAERSEVRLLVEARPGIRGLADRDRLAQVVGALLDNALRHTPRGGAITIGVDQAGDRAVLEVRDTGPGIAPADLPHVFERFYRADPARGRATGGTGLGLSIVAALVGAMGGRVVAGNDPAGGARFRVELPLAAPATPAAPAPPPPTPT